VRVAKGAAAKPAAEVDRLEVKPEAKQTHQTKLQSQLGESLFGVKMGTGATAPANPFANPFASKGLSTVPANPFAVATPTSQAMNETMNEPKADQASVTLIESFADKVRISSPPSTAQPARPHEPWPAESSFPAPYPLYYLDAEYEILEAPPRPLVPENVRMDIDTEGNAAGGKEDKEVFESSLDETFQKFADRVGQNPEQVLRYEFKGKPLLYSDQDNVGKLLAPQSENAVSANVKVMTSGSRSRCGMSSCASCGADRVFEVQLMPHAITELEADEAGIDGMEWGTVVVGVCSKDCKPSDVFEGDVGYVEEWAGVQWEENAYKR
jgi:pre-rRNA-processing protein TSR4